MLDDYKDICILLERKAVSDGLGGFDFTWTDGPEFAAAIATDASFEARRAEAQGVVSTYNVMVSKNVPLVFGTVFKRRKDGQLFRVTSSPSDMETPQRANLQALQVGAEKLTSLPG